jgi:hypothetical protein
MKKKRLVWIGVAFAVIVLLAGVQLWPNAYVIKPPDFGRLIEALDSLGNFWFKTATLPS